MLTKIHEIAISTLALPRYAKRIIAVILDLSLCILCTWFSFYLRLDNFISIKEGAALIAILFSISLALPDYAAKSANYDLTSSQISNW